MTSITFKSEWEKLEKKLVLPKRARSVIQKDFEEFNYLIKKHEEIISSIINKRSIKKLKFRDFNGEIKSLGAWGGDFILASGLDSPSYFKSKGYKTIIGFDDMIYRKKY